MILEKLVNCGLKIVCNPLTQKFLHQKFNINPNDFKLGFKKINGLWYSDIPNWPQKYEARQLMVNGSDKLLEELSNGRDYVTLHIKTAPFKDSIHLQKIDEDVYGGTYKSTFMSYTIWLCNVTKFLFGKHPDNIYFKPVPQSILI